MYRRQFAKLVIACAGLIPARSSLRPRGKVPEQKSFYVAGVRYCQTAPNLKTGDRVKVEPGIFKGERCYAILTKKNQRIGYVPQRIARTLDGCQILNSHISSFNNDTVPWKRVKVTVIIEAQSSRARLL